MPRPPIDPDSFDKVNFVIDAWTTGCDAPWYIYVETMKPAALAAFITLITFGWDDVARGYFRPKGLNPRRTGKRKGKWNKARPRFPELGELLGGKLPGAQEVQGQKWSNLAKTLWRVDGAMQAALFYWLVVDVVEQFAFDWTSLLYESYWCQDPALGKFSFQTIGWFAIPRNQWKKAGFGTEDYNHPPPGWVFTRGTTGAVPATITAALRVTARPPWGDPTSFRVVVWERGSHEILADSGTSDELVDGEIVGVATGNVPPNITFEVVAWMTGPSFANYGNGVVIGIEVKQ